jgi:predicted alpha/beta hydrolase
MYRGRVCTSPVTSTCEIPASDGYPLAATVFSSEVNEDARVAIVTCAMGVRRGRYSNFAEYLQRRGWTAILFDYRGIGGSRHHPVRNSGIRLLDWGEKDLTGVVDWAHHTFRPERCVVIGHSVGGQILGLARNHSKLSCAMLIGAQKGYTPYWDGGWRLLVTAFWQIVPLVTAIYGRLPMRIAGCDDLPPQVALDWQRWAKHPEFVDERWQSLGERYRRFTAALLAISFEDDLLYAPPRAARALLRLYPNARSEHWQVRPSDLGVARLGHSGFFDEGVCPSLRERAAKWLETAE